MSNTEPKTRLDLTNLDKVFFPQAKITKGDLINYYRGVSDLILPYLKDRPHSLLRQPDGIGGESFFQKNVDHAPPDWVTTIKIHSESTDEDVHYLVCEDLDHLLYMVQLGCIEINPWNSRTANLSKPDWLVIDLDPEKIGFEEVIETARAVKQICDELGIASCPKTSGKSGIHIFMPLAAKYSYKQTRQLAKILARHVNERLPKITSVTRDPAKRRGKVYVDFLQNSEGQTLAAPYSVRPTKEGTVSTPLHWDEVKKGLKPTDFNLKNIQRRLGRVGDLWKPVLGRGVDIKQILGKLS